ncbi:MAG: IPT/TIG domain-containing protein [Planctomycetes bacterium]|nr:IPT/TIG domain-containing protein [Planctomycetota bacterium]
MTPDGRFVVFDSAASNLVPNDRNNWTDVYFYKFIPVTLESATPSSGSDIGDDLVRLRGSGFTSTIDTTVSFGAGRATIVSFSPSEVVVRTPAGAGHVDVIVTTSEGTASLPEAFTYVAPELAARYGTVNLGRGDREDVLLVNSTAGDAFERSVLLRVGDPISVVMTAPSSRTTAAFALYGWMGTPNAETLTALPGLHGTLVFPAPFTGRTPQPRVIWNNIGRRQTLGQPTLPSNPAPSFVARRLSGASRPVRATLQGFIVDDGSQSHIQVSVTNAVVIRIDR